MRQKTNSCSPEEQPVILSCPLEFHEHIGTTQTLAVEGYFDFFLIPVFGIIGPAVPDGDRTRTVFSFRDIPLKCAVLERVVLHGDSQVFLARDFRNTLWHRPAFQYTFTFEAKIKV